MMADQIWEFLAGLGLFLLAMRTIENALRSLSTRTFRGFIKNHTRTPMHGVVVGVLSTICLQSSSLVGLILLAFVGAGIIHFRNALGIIYGANLGTTFTGWLVATLGFKLSLDGYALVPIAIGALSHIFIQPSRRQHHYGSLLLGFGFLLLGLGWMKSGMETLSYQVDSEHFRDYPLFLYFTVGVIFTALLQSSSATMAIILSALHSDLIPLQTAAAIAIGSDLGTTSTVLLGGMTGKGQQTLKGSPDKKRVALSHLAFNLLTDVLALILIIPLLFVVQEFFQLSDPLFVLVAFHSLFNLLGIALFLPLTSLFARWLERRFIETNNQACQHIHQTSSHVPEAALTAMLADMRIMLNAAVSLNLRVLAIPPGNLENREVLSPQPHHDYQTSYLELKRQEEELQAYAYQLASEPLDDQERESLNGLLSAVRNIVYSAKSLKDVRDNFIDFHRLPGHPVAATLRNDTENYYQHLFHYLDMQSGESGDEAPRLLNHEVAESHERLHQLITEGALKAHRGAYNNEEENTFSLSTLLNMNRELFVSNQNLAEAVFILRAQAEKVP